MARTKNNMGNLRDTLHLLYEESRTGTLEVTGDEGKVAIHLREGKVIHAEAAQGSEWRLGRLLTESGTISSRKLYRMLARHRKTGRPIENLLIEHGLLTPDVLARFLDLELRETLLPLFLQQHVHCEFRDEPPEVGEFVRPMPIPFLLKEAEKRAEQWPVLRRLGISREAVYDKTDDSIGHFLVRGTAAEMAADDEDVTTAPLGASERLVYYYVNGEKTVSQVAYASCLGEFETIRALALLRRRGYIYLKERQGQGESVAARNILPRVVWLVFYGLLATLLTFMIIWRPSELDELAAIITGQPVVTTPIEERAVVDRLHQAVRLHFALTGGYPPDLKRMSGDGTLEPDELGPWLERLEYMPRDEGYDLAMSGVPLPTAFVADEPTPTPPATEADPAPEPKPEETARPADTTTPAEPSDTSSPPVDATRSGEAHGGE